MNNSKLFIPDEYSKTLCEIVRSYEFRTRGGSSVGTALAECLETPQMLFGTLSHMLKFELNPVGGDKEPEKGFK